ncbi:MAG: hypothetical protein HY063_04000 [Bacteroidetes bacterium]|nr:hypothetical protein [Bacteroidota bacterium]
MRKIIFIFPIIIISLNASGQDGLIIRNSQNGKAWFYENGTRITYIKFKEDEYSTGKLNQLLSDTAVILGSDTVLLKEIAGIRKRNPLHKIARAAGMPLMFIGSIVMGEGAIDFYSSRNSENGVKFFLVGAGIFALGYLPYQINLGELTIGFGGEWKIEICRSCLTQ